MRDRPASSDVYSRTGVEISSASQSSNSAVPAAVISYTVRSGRRPSRVTSRLRMSSCFCSDSTTAYSEP